MGRLIQGLVDTSSAGFLLLAFMGLFALILLWVYRPHRRRQYEEVSKIPLRED